MATNMQFNSMDSDSIDSENEENFLVFKELIPSESEKKDFMKAKAKNFPLYEKKVCLLKNIAKCRVLYDYKSTKISPEVYKALWDKVAICSGFSCKYTQISAIFFF